MAHRDSMYRLSNLIEFDGAFVGGKRSGKRGRGADGKRPVLVLVEARTKRAFLARHLRTAQTVRTDASRLKRYLPLFARIEAIKQADREKCGPMRPF